MDPGFPLKKPTFVVQELGESSRLQTGSRRLEQWFCWEKAPQDSKNLASNVCDILEFRLSWHSASESFWVWAVMIFVNGQYSLDIPSPEVMRSGTVSRCCAAMWLSHVSVYHVDPGYQGRGPTRQFPIFLIPSYSEPTGSREMASSFIRNGKKVRLIFIIKNKEKNKLIALRRLLPLEETTQRTPRNWATLSQRNLSSSSSLLQVTFCQVANLKSQMGLSLIMKVCPITVLL